MSTETILLLSQRTLLTITIIIREYTELLMEKKGVLLPSGYEIARLAPNFTPFVFLDVHLGPKISQDISICCQKRLC